MDDIAHWVKIIGDDLDVTTHEDSDYIKEACDALIALSDAPWDTTTWSLWTNTLKEKTGRKGRALFMPLRQALTGFDHGPEMKDLLPYIGRDRAIARLTKAIG